jgi:hypothetical protein
MECRVKEIITLGDKGGAGHLIICEVVRMHIAKHVIDDRNRIDPDKMDLMGRMGRAYYVRCNGPAIHTIVQEYLPVTIGYDQLPEHIKSSNILTGNDLGKLAGQVSLPSEEAIANARMMEDVKRIQSDNSRESLHLLAKHYLDKGETSVGFSILMI